MLLVLHKMPTGIEGFDLITGGGPPQNRTTLLLGGPGSGKTVFALQTLVNGARQFGEPGIFVAFEENSRQILINAASFGWKLPELEKKQLLFVDAKMRPDVIKAGEFDLSGMLAGNQGRGRRERSQTNRVRCDRCAFDFAGRSIRGAVGISPDNHWLVAGSDDKTARLWRLQVKDLIDLARITVGRNFTAEESELYFPGQPYHKTFPNLPGPCDEDTSQ